MSTVTTKRKKSIWLWVLIIVAFTAIIAAVILNFLGIIDLSFIGVGFLSLQQWSALAVTNAVLLDIGLFLLGVAVYWILIKYFIGTKTTLPQQTGYPGTYQPAGQTISAPAAPSKDEVTIG